MGGAAATGAGIGIMGGTLGGIGDIIQAQNYHRPRLKEAFGPEQRLRQLAASQMIGGGQQLLGATALYNQMAPLLMGMLPGMHYVPPSGAGGGGGGGGVGGGSPGGGGTGGGSNPQASYQQSLQAYKDQQGRAQRLTQLNRQIKSMKKPSPERRALRQERKDLRQVIEGSPTAAQLERQQYMAGTQPDPSIFDVRQGVTPQDSLGSIRSLMDSLGGGGGNVLDAYRQLTQGGGGLMPGAGPGVGGPSTGIPQGYLY